MTSTAASPSQSGPWTAQEGIQKQLETTIAWCAERARPEDPKWSLRSREIGPDPSEWQDAEDPTVWVSNDIVLAVCDARAAMGLASSGAPARGRLMSCKFVDTNHNYGSAEYSAWIIFQGKLRGGRGRARKPSPSLDV